MESAIVDAHTGRILIKDLNSSTCVTVQSLQRFLVSASGSVTTAALSKKLRQDLQATRLTHTHIYTHKSLDIYIYIYIYMNEIVIKQ